MKIPGRDRATISPNKIANYLLSVVHPVGRHEAAFFLGHGFSADSGGVLAEALARHAEEHEVRHEEVAASWTKYVIDGVLRTPDGRDPVVRSIWIIEPGETSPRFVTAYPRPRPS